MKRRLLTLVLPILALVLLSTMTVQAGSLLQITPTWVYHLPQIYQGPAPTANYNGKPAPVSTVTPSSNPPPYSTSFYVQKNDPAFLYSLGCSLGTRDLNTPGTQDSLVILGFGQGWYENGQYGVLMFQDISITNPPYIFLNTTRVGDAVKEYIKGYWNCSGSDTTSQVTVGIGLNNYGAFTDAADYDDNRRRSHAYNQGVAWGQMAASMVQWVRNNGYSRQVTVVAAKDIEQGNMITSGQWNGKYRWAPPYVEDGWISGFSAGSGNKVPYYNYGACSGCWATLYSTASSYYSPFTANPSTGWSQADVWKVSWGAVPAWPVPEIYVTDGVNARQWQAISLFGAVYKGSRMDFLGVMTQSGACTTRDCHDVEKNTPEMGWTQLYNELKKSGLTRQDLLRWS
ncbi:MAG TPA: hypothetical protein VFF68_14945, partial [Anaerolineaceae bacterium]|nr:hypothetical protein [Anaerolineaceae bacterium]